MWPHLDTGERPSCSQTPEAIGTSEEKGLSEDSLEEKEHLRVPLDSSKNHLHIRHFSDNLSELHFNIMTDNLDLTFYNYCPNSYAFFPNMLAHAQAGVNVMFRPSCQL